MLQDFSIMAIIEQQGQTELKRFPLSDDLSKLIPSQWWRHYQKFITEKDEKEFIPSYTPDEHECARIRPYKDLPDCLKRTNSGNTEDIEEILINDIPSNSIKGLVAFAHYNNYELMLFQNVAARQIIRPGGILHSPLEPNIYGSIQGKAIGLENKIRAIYFPEEKKLLFDSYHIVKTFLPLSGVYDEASDQEIIKILDHDLFECVDSRMVAGIATSSIRRNFTQFKKSGRLNSFHVTDIEQGASEHNFDIQICNGKIVFPTDKNQIIDLLNFLNEKIFRSAITQELSQTNSMRPYERST